MREHAVTRRPRGRDSNIEQLRRRLLRMIEVSEADRKTSNKLAAEVARFVRWAP